MTRRNQFILALVVVVGLVLLLARWLMPAQHAIQPPPASAAVENPPPKALAAPITPAVVEPPAAAPSTKVVRPRRGGQTVRGRVYDESSGAGVAAAYINFRSASADPFGKKSRSRPWVQSANDGSFVLEGVPPGRVILAVSATGYASREVDVIVTNDAAPADIAVSTGGLISGHLTASDGVTPVAGSVGLYNVDENFGGPDRTGDAGEFSFDHLPPARYQLTGRMEGGTVVREIVLGKNQRVEGIVLALGKGATIRGVVTGLHAEELTRVRVSASRASDLFGEPDGVPVDERGAYALRGVPSGRLYVVANVAQRRQVAKAITMPADSDMTVNLDFAAGARVSGRITHGGKPVAGASVTPHPVHEQAVFFYGAQTSDDGRYVIEDLADGDYYLYVENYQAPRLSVSGDTVFNIDVPLAQLSGRILEEGGKMPIAGAEVEVWPTESATVRFRQHNRSGAAGDFALTGIEPGEIVLTAYKPGYEMMRKQISYDAPVSNMTLRLRQDAGVEVRVRDAANGRPLRELYAIEMIGERNGSRLTVPLSADGIGYLPGALAGATLTLSTLGYAPATVTRWDGKKLDLKFVREAP